MSRKRALRREEHSDHSAHASNGIEAAERGKAHALLEKDDLAHGLHLGAVHGRGETMKCSPFQGDA